MPTNTTGVLTASSCCTNQGYCCSAGTWYGSEAGIDPWELSSPMNVAGPSVNEKWVFCLNTWYQLLFSGSAPWLVSWLPTTSYIGRPNWSHSDLANWRSAGAPSSAMSPRLTAVFGLALAGSGATCWPSEVV